MRKFLIAAGLALAALAASPASAAPQTFAKTEALDRLPAEYTRHTREHRMMEIRRNTHRQRVYRHRGYGHGRPHYGRPVYGRPAYGHGRRWHRGY